MKTSWLILFLGASVAVAEEIRIDYTGPVVGFRRVALEAGTNVVVAPLAPAPVESGTVAGGGAGVVTAAQAAWTEDEWAGREAVVGRTPCRVEGNSTNELFVTAEQPLEPQPGEPYQILPTTEEFLGITAELDDSTPATNGLPCYVIEVAEPTEIIVIGSPIWKEEATE